MITIQALSRPEELAVIRRLADGVWPDTYRRILSPEQITYMMHLMYDREVLEKELAEGMRFDVMYDDGEPVGFAAYAPYGEAGVWKLHKLYLLASRHSRGLGSRMLEHVAAAVAAAGGRELWLNVNKHNERAIRAYLRNGFSRREAVQVDIGGGFLMDDYVMQRIL